MDFSAWSPSHTLLVAITLLGFGVQLIVILVSLKIRTQRLEQRQDKTDNQIETAKLEMTKQISEVRSEMNQGFSDLRGEISGVRDELRDEIRDVRTEMNQQVGSVREELSKLNQNHINHLTRHDS